MTNFDPYQRWLGIPLADQPPHLYRLLGLELFEVNPEIIKSAAENSIAFIQQNAFGVELQQSQRVLKELAAACKYLQSPTNKANYDRKLKIKLGLLKPKPAAKNPDQRKTGHRKSDQTKHEQVTIPKQSDHKKLNLLGIEFSYLAAGLSAVVLFSLIVAISILFKGGDSEVVAPLQLADNKIPVEKVEPTPEATSKSPQPAAQKKNPAPKKTMAAVPKPDAPLPLPAEAFTGRFTVRADSLNKEPGKQLPDVTVDVIYQPGSKKSERVLLGTIKTDAKGEGQLQVKLTPKEQTGRFLVKLTREKNSWERKLINFPNELTQTLSIPVAIVPEYLNPAWIEQRLEQLSIDQLIEEYRNVKDPLVQTVRAALDLSHHILRDHPEALREQLQARLMTQVDPELAVFQTLPDQQIHIRSEWPAVDQAGGSLIRTYRGHSRYINCLAITPDGNYAASGGDDRLIKIWDLANQSLISSIKAHSRDVNCLAITPDGKQIISGSSDKTLKIWDLKNGQLKQTLTGHSGSVSCLTVSPDGKHVVSGASNNELKIWDVTSGKEIRAIRSPNDNVSSVAISPDGKQILSGSSNNLIIYNFETGRQIRTIKSEGTEFNDVVITPDGNYFISGGNSPKVRILSTGKAIRDLKELDGSIICLALSADGRHVIGGTYGRTLSVWEVESGNKIQTFKGHSDLVNCVALSSDGRRIVSASHDKTVKLWNPKINTPNLIDEMHAKEVTSVVISPDGKQAVSCTRNELKIWDLMNATLAKEINENSSNTIRATYLPDE